MQFERLFPVALALYLATCTAADIPKPAKSIDEITDEQLRYLSSIAEGSLPLNADFEEEVEVEVFIPQGAAANPINLDSESSESDEVEAPVAPSPDLILDYMSEDESPEVAVVQENPAVAVAQAADEEEVIIAEIVEANDSETEMHEEAIMKEEDTVFVTESFQHLVPEAFEQIIRESYLTTPRKENTESTDLEKYFLKLEASSRNDTIMAFQRAMTERGVFSDDLCVLVPRHLAARGLARIFAAEGINLKEYAGFYAPKNSKILSNYLGRLFQRILGHQLKLADEDFYPFLTWFFLNYHERASAEKKAVLKVACECEGALPQTAWETAAPAVQPTRVQPKRDARAKRTATISTDENPRKRQRRNKDD